MPMLGVVCPFRVSEVPDCDTALFCNTSRGGYQCGRLLWRSIGKISFTRLQRYEPEASTSVLAPAHSLKCGSALRAEGSPSQLSGRPVMFSAPAGGAPPESAGS